MSTTYYDRKFVIQLHVLRYSPYNSSFLYWVFHDFLLGHISNIRSLIYNVLSLVLVLATVTQKCLYRTMISNNVYIKVLPIIRYLYHFNLIFPPNPFKFVFVMSSASSDITLSVCRFTFSNSPKVPHRRKHFDCFLFWLFFKLYRSKN